MTVARLTESALTDTKQILQNVADRITDRQKIRGAYCRSHLIFRITMESFDRRRNDVEFAQLMFVDLAGFEESNFAWSRFRDPSLAALRASVRELSVGDEDISCP